MNSFERFYSILSLWFKRYILYPLGLACPVVLTYAESSVTLQTAAKGHRTTLLDLIKTKCPSIYGPYAWYFPTPGLANGHLSTM